VEDPAEVPALLKFADEYLKVEQSRDKDKIWEMIAPSAAFKKTHTRELFDLMMDENKVEIKEFIIHGGIVFINDDKKGYPTVERIGYVEVDIIFQDGDFTWTATYFLPFLKENGKWYKG
jgi:hypothetical protein